MNDVDLYCRYAEKTGGPVLELACGTGRLALPLAQHGFDVWGVDLSRDMLNQFYRKLDASSDEIRTRIHLTYGDMTNFDLNMEFGLVFIGFSSFQGLTTRQLQEACLKGVYKHLSEMGLFIVDVFRPLSHPLNRSWIKEETMIAEIVTDTGIGIRYGDVRRDIDTERQIIYPDLVYYVTHPDGREEKVVEPLAMSYFYEEQLRELLESCGFEVVEAFGDHDGGQIGEGPRLIFVCRKARAS